MVYSMRWLRAWIVVLITVSMVLACTVVVAQGKGKGRSDEPLGWQKGEKKGWKGGVPPGIEKKGGWMPPGLSKQKQAEWKNGRPPGWSRGEKEGWKGADMPPGLAKKGGKLPSGLAKNTPPGFEKWNDKKKKGWEKKLGKEKAKVRGTARRLKGFSNEDLDSAVGSVEAAARKGVPIIHARGLVEKAMKKGIRGKGLETASRAMAYGVSKEVDFDQLGKFVHKKLDEGLRDDELSIEIYKEIARRHDERLKTKKSIQQKKEKGKKR